MISFKCYLLETKLVESTGKKWWLWDIGQFHWQFYNCKTSLCRVKDKILYYQPQLTNNKKLAPK
jgi:hypothetical protein